MIKSTVLLVILIILFLPSAAMAVEPAEGTIEGTIINSTPGGGSVAEQDVTLDTYLGETQEDSIITRTDNAGRFIFSDLSIEPDYAYVVTLDYQGADYSSETMFFGEDEVTKSAEIIVYDSTTSNEALTVALSHTIIYIDESGLIVKEYYLFANDSGRTYIGPTGEKDSGVLFFSLPEGAIELEPTLGLMGCCIITGPGGFAETMSVLPNMKEVSFSYRVSPNSGTFTYSQTINYLTTRFDFLVQESDISVASDQLALDEPMFINDVNYEHFTALEELTPGDTLVIQLSGLPWSNNQGTAIWVLLAFLVVIAGYIILFIIRKRKKTTPVITDLDLNLRRQQLISEIAAIDDSFDDGRITEQEHQRSRNEKKAELMKVIQTIKDNEPAGNG